MGRFSALRDAQGRALGALEEADDVNDIAFEFRVTGHEPRPWGTGQAEWKWRGEVAAAIRAAAKQAGRVLPLAVAGSEAPSLAVGIVFRLTPKRFASADLHYTMSPIPVRRSCRQVRR